MCSLRRRARREGRKRGSSDGRETKERTVDGFPAKGFGGFDSDQETIMTTKDIYDGDLIS